MIYLLQFKKYTAYFKSLDMPFVTLRYVTISYSYYCVMYSDTKDVYKVFVLQLTHLSVYVVLLYIHTYIKEECVTGGAFLLSDANRESQ